MTKINPMQKPIAMSGEEVIKQAVDEISACFEGYMLGRNASGEITDAEKIHPEIKDEFRLTLRSALASYTAYLMEKVGNENAYNCEEHKEWNKGYKDALSRLKFTLQQEIEKLTEGRSRYEVPSL